MKLSDKNWNEQCDYMEHNDPAIHEFLEMWGPHCGAPRSVFRGHLCKMLMEINWTIHKARNGGIK